MKFKKLLTGLAACLMATTLFAGCNSGGDKGGDDTKKPAATPSAKIELKGEPTATFQFAKKTAKIYQLDEPAADKDFNFEGQRIVYAGDSIYIHGEASDGKGGDVQGLYKLPLKDNKITGRELVAESDGSDGDYRNLAVSRGNVLFKLKENDKLAIYNGKSVDKSDSRWKDDYDSMVGFVEGAELLMVRDTDTICVGTQELSDITGVKVIAEDVQEKQNLEGGAMRPVYADINELFVSSPTSFDDFKTVLLSFDKNGKLIHRYEGVGAWDWAVTKNYVLQAGDDAMVIYDRASGEKLYDSKVRDFAPQYLYSLGGDMVLAYGRDDRLDEKFFVLNLE
ncbi:MAG: hypothetical protein IJ849_11875 [Selenomonadaceae bacterium]|nr:hypothetical protein [Selenomonadaceae bacterium]